MNIKVSKEAWDALQTAFKARVIIAPALEQRWIDQCCTSDASRAAGGMAKLNTDYDWLLLFFAWAEGVDIPRD